MNTEYIKVDEVIHSTACDTPESGDKIYNKIKDVMKKYNGSKNYVLVIDFSKISGITSAFLNNAIGTLFFEYEHDDLLSILRFRGLKTEDDVKTIKLAVTNAIMLSKYKK